MKTKIVLLVPACLVAVVIFCNIKPSIESERNQAKAVIEKVFGELIHNVDVGYAAGGVLSVGFTDSIGNFYVVSVSNGRVEHPEWLTEKKATFRKFPNLHHDPAPYALDPK